MRRNIFATVEINEDFDVSRQNRIEDSNAQLPMQMQPPYPPPSNDNQFSMNYEGLNQNSFEDWQSQYILQQNQFDFAQNGYFETNYPHYVENGSESNQYFIVPNISLSQSGPVPQQSISSAQQSISSAQQNMPMAQRFTELGQYQLNPQNECLLQTVYGDAPGSEVQHFPIYSLKYYLGPHVGQFEGAMPNPHLPPIQLVSNSISDAPQEIENKSPISVIASTDEIPSPLWYSNKRRCWCPSNRPCKYCSDHM